MYSNIPCECLQFSDQNRAYNEKCPLIGMFTADLKERAITRKKKLASTANVSGKNRVRTEIRRIKDSKKQLERKKQKVLDELTRNAQNLGSKTFGEILETRLSLLQKRMELIAINNELEAKDKELDQYRSAEEIVLREVERARARLKRKDAIDELKQNKQEQRSREMERKIDKIADKLRIW